jgi:hypothetical protein
MLPEDIRKDQVPSFFVLMRPEGKLLERKGQLAIAENANVVFVSHIRLPFKGGIAPCSKLKYAISMPDAPRLNLSVVPSLKIQSRDSFRDDQKPERHE